MGLADPLRSRCLMLRGEGRRKGQRKWAGTLRRAPGPQMDTRDGVTDSDRKVSLNKLGCPVWTWVSRQRQGHGRGGFEDVLTLKD